MPIERVLRWVFRLVLVAWILLGLSGVSFAQDSMQYEIDWYFQGANSPFQSDNIMGDDSDCEDEGELPSVPNNVVNPSIIFLEHDSDADGDTDLCEFSMSSLPRPLAVGDYYGRAKARSLRDPRLVSGGSADSNPFGVEGVPVDPGGLVIR